MADMVTKQELEAAKIDVKHAGEAVNEKKIVTPRYGASFKSLPLAIQEVIETGGFEPFATESALLASVPTLTKKAAKALDTKKIWIYEARGGVTKWWDTGLSELELANEFTKKRIDLKGIGAYEFIVNDKHGNVALSIAKNGVVEASKLKIADSLSSSQKINGYHEARVDQSGHMVFGIRKNGSVEAHKLNFAGVRTSKIKVNGYKEVWVDAKGNIALSIKNDGTVYAPKFKTGTSHSNSISASTKTLTIKNSDTIMHIGDSMTAAHYVGENKGYVSQLSQLSPFRHVNYGVTDTNLLDMQNRIISDTTVFGATLKSVKPKYLFIASYANDGQFFNAGMQYYQENLRRLIDVALAHGVQPVLVGYFFMTTEYHQAIKSIADEYQIPVIWNDVMNKQIGFYNTVTMFHQWHIGSRTGALWWMPMLEYVNQQKPMRTLKVFRKRKGFNANSDSDLLFKGMVDKTKKWKEINIGHYSLTNEAKYDELDTLEWNDFYPFIYHEDEYVKLANNQAVNFEDFGMIEMSFDAYSRNINLIEISLKVSGSAQFFVRDNIATESAMPNILPSDPLYQENWNKPRGAWRAVELINGKILIKESDIANSMIGNKLFLMMKGSFDLTDISIDYLATKYESSLPTLNEANKRDHLGSELLAQPLLGNEEQLSNWITSGTVKTLIPIDLAKSPRKPDQNVPVDGVVTLTTSNHLQQKITFAMSEEVRTFKVVAWARLYPKAFFDRTNPAYSDLDPAQIEDRSVAGAIAPINKDTADVEEIRLETWVNSKPSSGGAEYSSYVSLVWRPVTFYVEVQPFETNLSIRLSAASGEVQLAKCSIKEVL